MATDLNYPQTTVSNWTNANSYPRIDKIQEMANYFGIRKSDLTELKESDKTYVHFNNVPLVGVYQAAILLACRGFLLPICYQ